MTQMSTTQREETEESLLVLAPQTSLCLLIFLSLPPSISSAQASEVFSAAYTVLTKVFFFISFPSWVEAMRRVSPTLQILQGIRTSPIALPVQRRRRCGDGPCSRPLGSSDRSTRQDLWPQGWGILSWGRAQNLCLMGRGSSRPGVSSTLRPSKSIFGGTDHLPQAATEALHSSNCVVAQAPSCFHCRRGHDRSKLWGQRAEGDAGPHSLFLSRLPCNLLISGPQP